MAVIRDISVARASTCLLLLVMFAGLCHGFQLEDRLGNSMSADATASASVDAETEKRGVTDYDGDHPTHWLSLPLETPSQFSLGDLVNRGRNTDYYGGKKTYGPPDMESPHYGTDFPWAKTVKSVTFGQPSYDNADVGWIVAAADGKVIHVIDDVTSKTCSGKRPFTKACGYNDKVGGGRLGNSVWIEHPQARNYITGYGHMHPGTVQVKKGQMVKCGQRLGRVGNSGFSFGPHLHFMVKTKNGLDTPIVDPFNKDERKSMWVQQGPYKSLPAKSCKSQPSAPKPADEEEANTNADETQENETPKPQNHLAPPPPPPAAATAPTATGAKNPNCPLASEIPGIFERLVTRRWTKDATNAQAQEVLNDIASIARSGDFGNPWKQGKNQVGSPTCKMNVAEHWCARDDWCMQSVTFSFEIWRHVLRLETPWPRFIWDDAPATRIGKASAYIRVGVTDFISWASKFPEYFLVTDSQREIAKMTVYAGDFITYGRRHIMMARKTSEAGKPVEVVEGNSNLNHDGDAITRRNDRQYWGPILGRKLPRNTIGFVIRILKCPKGNPLTSPKLKELTFQQTKVGKYQVDKQVDKLLDRFPYLRPGASADSAPEQEEQQQEQEQEQEAPKPSPPPAPPAEEPEQKNGVPDPDFKIVVKKTRSNSPCGSGQAAVEWAPEMDIDRPVAKAGQAADLRFGGGGDYVYLCASEEFLGSSSPKKLLLVAGQGEEAKEICTKAGGGYETVGPNLRMNQGSAQYQVYFCAHPMAIGSVSATGSGSCPRQQPKKLSVNIGGPKAMHVCVQE